MKLIWCTVALLVFSGCTQKDAGSQNTTAGDETAPSLTLHNISFAPEHAVLEVFQETFSTADSEQASAVREIELTDMLVAGPNFVTAKVTPNDGSLAVALAPDDFAMLWTYERMDSFTALEATVTTPGSLDLVLTYGGVIGTAIAAAGDHAQGVEYEIEVTVQAGPTAIPTGVAIEVELPTAGSFVRLTGTEGDVSDILLFGPDDSALGLIKGGAVAEIKLAANGTTGPYVVLPQGHGGFYQLQVGAVDAPENYRPKARPLSQTIEAGNAATLPDGLTHDHEWSVSAPKAPIQVGLCFSSSQGYATAPEGAITSPAGDELGKAVVDNPGVPGFSGCFFTEMGDERLEVGTYGFAYTDSSSHNVQVQEYMIYFAR